MRGERERLIYERVQLLTENACLLDNGFFVFLYDGRYRFVFDAELVGGRCAVFECLLGQLLLPAQLVAVFGKGTQYRCRPLAVQLQRVEGGCYLPHTRSALSHTFEDT